ncbi:MAG: hypothetical protein JO322_02570 [Candidatus Eremiobacteraeota bacterium]|nr:hypothetical protein [Candidatus Eremiobacteraeota bacterium]
MLAVSRLPKLAQNAMRASVVDALERGRMTPRAVINDALMRFERDVQSEAPDGVRPALLFSERDRIVRELRGFIDGRLATRLAALRHRDVFATGGRAAPFDAIVRNRFGHAYAIVLRRIPRDGSRLDLIRRIAKAAEHYGRVRLSGAVLYDFASGSARLIPVCAERTNPIRVPARASRRSVA